MDAVDPALVDQATKALVTLDGVKEVRELRIRWIGHRLRAEADITADPSLTITQAHELAHLAEDRLLAWSDGSMLPMSMSVPSGRTRTPTKFSYLPLFTLFPTGADSATRHSGSCPVVQRCPSVTTPPHTVQPAEPSRRR